MAELVAASSAAPPDVESRGVLGGRLGPRAITAVGAGVNVLLSVAKLAAGTLTGSSALIADAYHSCTDLISDAICMLATLLPQVEQLCVLAIGVLITTAGSGMVYSACSELWLGSWGHASSRLSMLAALAVTTLSVLSKELLFRATRLVGLRCHSASLLANAHHHRSDAMSSVAAAVGIAGSLCGIGLADSIAAAAVGVMVLRLGVETVLAGCARCADESCDGLAAV